MSKILLSMAAVFMISRSSFAASDSVMIILKQSSELIGASLGCGNETGAKDALHIWEATLLAGLDIGRIKKSEEPALKVLSRETSQKAEIDFKRSPPPVPCDQVKVQIAKMKRSLGLE